MTRPLDPELSERAIEAMERLDVAQQELASAMAELIVPDHADTTFVTERVRAAFTEVAAAKVALATVLRDPSSDSG